MVSFDFCRKVFAFSALICVIGAPLPSQAATAIDTACDPAFLDRLKERAWGEAQREMMTNKQMIWKPDSVLALGCYSQWISAMGVSFTKDNGNGLKTITNQAQSYLTASFNHSLGGGNLPGPKQSSVCSNISALWQGAQCGNLNLTMLQTLGEAKASDPRIKPTACNSPGAEWAKVTSVMTVGGANAPYDKMSLFTSIVAPKSEAGACSAGIKTGVSLAQGNNPEIVCPNPGCYPDGKANPKCQ
ncbi:MAG TPA: hypothetical protein PKI93_03685 [Alphaproteobacteria bacterium]|nr:hypothetical protein [Alphaproteobacteria bacterium]HNS44626.1 hypothetical protein [Alphaproteobacteria bacterium]